MDFEDQVGNINPKRTFLYVLTGIVVVVFLFMASEIFETNDQGYYQIKQAAVTGTMTAHSEPGTYLQMFGTIHTYQLSDMYYFSKSKLDGGSGIEADPIQVRFNDGGTAKISGSLKFRLSLVEKDQFSLHQDFKSYRTVHKDLIRQVVTESLMQTATLMKAEESYSSRRSEFTSLAENQIRRGIFETIAMKVKRKDVEGNSFIESIVNVKLSDNGIAVIRKISPFRRYNIEILQFVIKEIDFDKTIDDLIAKKKEAEQAKVVARSNAERAKQDAITVEEQGKARIAKAKADEDVKKIQATTEAQKNWEVAILNKKKAIEDAKAKKVRGEAEAHVARLKVKAGLTPLQRATIKKETAIGVAGKLATIKFPGMMVIGGGKGGAMNPFDAVGLESFMRISKKMVNVED